MRCLLDELPGMLEDAAEGEQASGAVEDVIDGWGRNQVFPAEILEQLEGTLDRGARRAEESLDEEIDRIKRKRALDKAEPQQEGHHSGASHLPTPGCYGTCCKHIMAS